MLSSLLQILNIKYFRQFWIIKFIGFKSIIFAITMDVVSSSKLFSTFDLLFLLVIVVT